MRHWLVSAAWLTVGCATVQPAVPSAETEPADVRVDEDVRLDGAGLDDAREALKEGDMGAARRLSDSVYEAWLGDPALRRGEARELADVLARLGSEDRAARLLVHAPTEVGSRESSRLRGLTEILSIAELRDLIDSAPPESSVKGVVTAELARALALAGHTSEARATARIALEEGADGDDQQKAVRVLDGDVTAESGDVRVGVILPGSGRFALVGEQILEGVLLAVEQARLEAPDRRFDLVVVDDSSSVEGGSRRAEELEREGVAAIVGPIRSEALASAVVRRRSDDLVLLSPTASEGPVGAPNAYTIWDMTRRVTDPVVEVAKWMIREMGLRTLGLMHPEGIDPQITQRIREAVESAGGKVVGVAPYVPDSTTFEAPITFLAEREPDGVIVMSDGPRTVLQMAPQLVYYGLRRWVVGGDANWSDPSVVRRLDASYADYRLVGTYVDRVSQGTAWEKFEMAYEEKYRKAMPSNMFSALGYDAMRLVLLGLPEVDPERRGSVGRAIRRVMAFPGATGSFHVDPGTGDLVREASVRVIRNGDLVAPDARELIEWAAAQRELEEFLKELEETKEDAEPGSAPTVEDGR